MYDVKKNILEGDAGDQLMHLIVKMEMIHPLAFIII